MHPRAKRELLDKLHRGFVVSMIGITAVGFALVCQSFYGMLQTAKQKEKLMLAELTDKEDPEEFPSNARPRNSFH